MTIKRKIFEFIVDERTRWNYTPKRSVIHKFFAGMTDDVDLHLEQLEREGILTLAPDGGEDVAISPTFHQAPQMKFHRHDVNRSDLSPETMLDGYIALDLRGAGISMELNMFALRVVDESMLDAGLQRGDIAILKHASPVRGDVVAVDLEGQMVLRRYVVVAGIPHVLAENPFRPDLHPCWELPLHGVLWGSLRTEPNRYLPDHVRSSRVVYSNPPSATQPLSFRNRVPKDVVSANNHTKCNGLRQSGPRGKRGAKTAAETKPADFYLRPEAEWPHPPTGIELNDMASLEYRGSNPSLVDDESGYGQHLQQAVKDYEEREKIRA